MKQRRVKPKRKKSLIAALSVTASAVILIIVAVFLFLNWHPLADSVTSQSQSNQNEYSKTEKSAPNEQLYIKNYLVCGIDDTGSLTDVIMIVSLNNADKKINILQIPRDTYVDLDIPTNKYNAVYSHHEKGVGGMETLKSQVEKDFGLDISNYGAITTTGFRSMVDAVGGVYVDVPKAMDYDDPEQDLHIHLNKGKQLLDGEKAEQFVRYRKGWSDGDIGRLSAQQLFLNAFADKVKELSTASFTAKVLPVLNQQDFKTDMSVLDMINFFNFQRGISLSESQIHTMPGEYYTSDEGLSMFSANKGKLVTLLNSFFVSQDKPLNESDLGIKERDK